MLDITVEKKTATSVDVNQTSNDEWIDSILESGFEDTLNWLSTNCVSEPITALMLDVVHSHHINISEDKMRLTKLILGPKNFHRADNILVGKKRKIQEFYWDEKKIE